VGGKTSVKGNYYTISEKQVSKVITTPFPKNTCPRYILHHFRKKIVKGNYYTISEKRVAKTIATLFPENNCQRQFLQYFHQGQIPHYFQEMKSTKIFNNQDTWWKELRAYIVSGNYTVSERLNSTKSSLELRAYERVRHLHHLREIKSKQVILIQVAIGRNYEHIRG